MTETRKLESVCPLALRAMIDANGKVILCQPVSGDVVAVYPAHYTNKPRRGQLSTMVNCCLRPLIWHSRQVQTRPFR